MVFCKTDSGRIVEADSLMELVDGSWVPARNLLLGDVFDARVIPEEEASKLPDFTESED